MRFCLGGRGTVGGRARPFTSVLSVVACFAFAGVPLVGACASSSADADVGVDGGDTSEVADGAAPDSTAVDVLAEVRDAADAGGDSDLDATDTRPPTDLSPPFPDVDAGACVEGAPCAAVISGPCQVGRCNALGQCVTVPAVGCCTSDSDCDDFTAPSACEVLRCTNTMCTPDPRPGCCVSSDGCDDGLACTVDLCSGAGGRCAHCASGCDCPGPFEVYSNDFSASDPQAAGFFIEDLDPTDGVSWRPTIRRFISPPASMRLGDTICPTYYSGALNADCQPVDPAGADAGVVEATLYSPPISLPLTPGGHAGLVWVWSDVEPLGTGGPGERDVLRVSVDPGLGVAWPASSSLAVGKSTGGAWRLLAFDLAPYGGATVRLRFAFDTLDASANHHEGVYLDDLSVVSRCQGGCCATDADCAGIAGDAGADGCRSPRCIDLDDGAGKVCALLPDDPALPCTACDSPGSPGSPGSNVACDDQNPCTADSCDNGGVCRHDAFCCFEQLVLSAGFEDGLAGWFVTDDQPTDTVGWRSTHDLAVVGGSSAWFGDPGTGNYAGDARVSGSLSSATVVMPKVGASGAEAQVSFWLRLGTEWDGQLYDNPAGLDRLTLSVIASGSAAEVWSSDEVGGSTGGLWVPVSVPLESYAGRAVQLRFVFDSVDGTANEHEGAYIDGLELGARCGTP